MKIKKVICMNNITKLKGGPRTLDSKNFLIEYSKNFNAILVDGEVLIPMGKILEVHIDKEDNKDAIK